MLRHIDPSTVVGEYLYCQNPRGGWIGSFINVGGLCQTRTPRDGQFHCRVGGEGITSNIANGRHTWFGHDWVFQKCRSIDTIPYSTASIENILAIGGQECGDCITRYIPWCDGTEGYDDL